MDDEITKDAATETVKPVPAHIIPAELPHPNISTPLARGIYYGHQAQLC